MSEMQHILDALPTGTLVRDGDGRVVQTNRAMAGILGLGENRLRGCSHTGPLTGVPRAADRAEFARTVAIGAGGDIKSVASRRGRVLHPTGASGG